MNQQSKQQSSLFIKRQQFHSTIRRQQLDQYRQKKRLELFADKGEVNYQNRNVQSLNSMDADFNVEQAVKYSPYSFNRQVQQYMIRDIEAKLSSSKYSLQTIEIILNELITLDLMNVVDTQNHNIELLNPLCRILLKCLKKIYQIPNNSIIYLNNKKSIDQMIYKIFSCWKKLLEGLITQQNYIKSELIKNEKKYAYCKQICKKSSREGKQLQPIIQQVLDRHQSLNQQQVNHPIQKCIDEVFQMLGVFSDIYLQKSIKLNQDRQNLKITQQQLNSKQLTFFFQLWYLTSSIQSQLFTSNLCSFYHQKLQQTCSNSLGSNQITFITETICNYLITQMQYKERVKNQSIKIFHVSYENDLVLKFFTVFEYLMTNYTLGDESVKAILKTICHQIRIKPAIMLDVLNQKNTIEQLIQMLLQQKSIRQNIKTQLQGNKISINQYYQHLDAKSILNHNVKKQIYSTLGMLFSFIDNQSQFACASKFISKISDLIMYQISQITHTNSYLEIQSNFYIREVEAQQEIVSACMFLLFNASASSKLLIQQLVQKQIIGEILNLWNYTHQNLIKGNFGNSLNNKSSKDQFKNINLIQQSIINFISNMIVQMSFSHHTTSNSSTQPQQNQLDQNLSQLLIIIIQYKQSGLIKLLIDYLKQAAYDLQMCHVNKQTLLYGLKSVKNILKFVIAKSLNLTLIQNLENSNGFTLNSMEAVLNIIMNSQNKFNQGITNQALKCLQYFDQIVKDKRGDYQYQNEYYNENAHNVNRQNQIEQNYQKFANNLNQNRQNNNNPHNIPHPRSKQSPQLQI